MSNFLKIFKNIYEESFPLTKVKLQYRNRLPWLSDGLKASIKRKNKLYLTSLKHPTLYNILKYKQYKNKLTALLKCEEKHFYQSQTIKNKCNLRKVWIIIEQVINKTRSSRKSEQFMLNNGITVDPKVIAHGFNNIFINIGPTLASKINTGGISHITFMPESLQSSFFLEPTNTNEVKQVINNLKDESISYPLSRIANLSFEQGIFLEELKLAVVSPLYKAKDPMFF